MLKEPGVLCREVNNTTFWVVPLFNERAVIRQTPGGTRQAFALFDEAAQPAEEHGLTDMAQEIKRSTSDLPVEMRRMKESLTRDS
jgi:hypothetical protein